ncbi:hypothetical protein [Actinoplanes sp. NPDC051411]|uniref:hypothetical protein n=1 Tax=Actinoplanes sp. NPDC051411 TaxID=3155522 RepID=UPI003422CB65
MHVTVTRAATGSTCATIRRDDGVVLELPGYDRTFRVPHDLAHAVTERALGLSRGVFGSIAGGGVFDNMRVVAGRRPRHDAAERSRRLLAANKAELGRAELIAGVMHQGVEHHTDPLPRAREAWHAFTTDPFPCSDDEFRAAAADLAALADAYTATGTVEFTWPTRLTSPVPPPVVKKRRGRQ